MTCVLELPHQCFPFRRVRCIRSVSGGSFAILAVIFDGKATHPAGQISRCERTNKIPRATRQSATRHPGPRLPPLSPPPQPPLCSTIPLLPDDHVSLLFFTILPCFLPRYCGCPPACTQGKRRYTTKLWRTFTDCFNCLPIAAIVDDKIFCAHGGLSPELFDMEQINRVARPTDVHDTGGRGKGRGGGGEGLLVVRSVLYSGDDLTILCGHRAPGSESHNPCGAGLEYCHGRFYRNKGDGVCVGR